MNKNALNFTEIGIKVKERRTIWSLYKNQKANIRIDRKKKNYDY